MTKISFESYQIIDSDFFLVLPDRKLRLVLRLTRS